MSKKIIAVVGATGNQGSSVAKTFLQLPDWHVRCLTRSTASEKAIALQKAGAEVVQADLDDVQSLLRAFSGAHAIFVNTDFWGIYRPALASGVALEAATKLAYDTETARGRNAADAAAQTPTLERFVYSALGPMTRASGGKYTHSTHWETKAAIVDYIQEHHADGLAKKSSYIYLGAYTTNPFLMPRLDPKSGGYISIMPFAISTKMPVIDPSASTGPFVKSLIETEAPGTKLLAYDSMLTLEQILDLWSKMASKPYKFIQMAPAQITQLTGVTEEILEGATYLGEYPYCAGVEGVIEPPQLQEQVVTTSLENYWKATPVSVLLGEGPKSRARSRPASLEQKQGAREKRHDPEPFMREMLHLKKTDWGCSMLSND